MKFTHSSLTAAIMAATVTLTAGPVLAAAHAGPSIGQAMVDQSTGTVTFDKITAAADGYIVIHATDADGNVVVPGSIAHTAVSAGENADVMVDLGAKLMAGATYIAMLHLETNGNQTYDFGEGMTDVDGPVMVGENMAIMAFDG